MAPKENDHQERPDVESGLRDPAENHEGENAKFIKEETKVEIRDSKSKSKTHSQSNGRKCCCCQCTRKMCLIITGSILLAIGALLLFGYLRYALKYKGSAEETSAEEIMADLSGRKIEEREDISGIYKLVKYDDQYRNYLSKMGIPSLIVSLIISFNDIIEISAPADPEAPWIWKSETSTGTQTLTFKLGEEFEVPYGSRTKGVKHKTCDISPDSDNVLVCHFEERQRGWKGVEMYTFTSEAMIEVIDFQSANVSTVLKFEKTTHKELEMEEEESKKDSPFSSDDDDDDDEFGSFDNFMEDF